MTSRHTLAGEARLAGWGLHGGRACAVTLAPAGPGAGRTFVKGGVRIPATVAHVVDARRATTLGRDGARVGMVEHLLAALLVRGIDDADLHVEGDEVPLLDGCARAWADAVDALGTRAQGQPHTLRPRVPFAIDAGAESTVQVAPAQALSLDVRVHYAPHPASGDGGLTQRWHGRDLDGLLDARTFGFPHERDALRAQGLAAGVDRGFADGAIHVPGQGAARGHDELARHKALDLLGDLALLGRRLQARVTVTRGGHALHHRLVSRLTLLDSAGSQSEDTVSPLEVR